MSKRSEGVSAPRRSSSLATRFFAFTLLALVALHIGVAIQDYMTDRRPDDGPDGV